MVLTALKRIVVSNTFLGETITLLKESTDTTEIFVGSFFVFKQAMMNCSQFNPSSCSLIIS